MIYKQPLDVVIVDDIFPHPLSAFRMQEFISYLKAFKDLEICSTGASVGLLDERTFDKLISDFKAQYPEHAGRIKKLQVDTIINAKLIYAVFLINIYLNIQKIEELNIPFVFTLYPGGGFGLNTAESDKMLKRVISSPCFRKVIVTQKVTYDYLIDNNYCRPDQIKFIFGVVTPLDHINSEYVDKKHFGIDKEILDICFVAYKYTKKGVDKGYDIFIDVANLLCQKHNNIKFHVVGGIDEHEIDVTNLKGKINFYGKRDTEWFNTFYKDKDIILSPNIPKTMYPGSFDGFPTGSCVDAGLRKTAIFCTDELNLNKKVFSDGNEFVPGEELIIIPHNAKTITSMIEAYYYNPHKLKAISENGSRTIKRLFGFEAQMLPRINLLKKEIELAGSTTTTLKIRDNSTPIRKQNTSSIRSVAKLLLQVVIGRLISIARRTIRKIKMLFHQIRVLLAPAGSRRALLLRRMYDNSFGKLMNLIRDRITASDPVSDFLTIQYVVPQFKCSLCQNDIDGFNPLGSYYEENWNKYGFPFGADDFETLNSNQYFCPKCGAADRDRLYALYISRVMNRNLSEKPITIIDIAPSPPLRNFLLKYSNIKYQSADKFMKDVDLVVDITNMYSIPQETYDFFICSHVLEHVVDDKKALSELFRILKIGGSGILMVPINLSIDKIEEDPNIDDIGERWRRFGQDDHIRLYSKRGFIERVEEAGFTINQYGVDFFGEDIFFQYEISPKSILYIVKKN